MRFIKDGFLWGVPTSRASVHRLAAIPRSLNHFPPHVARSVDGFLPAVTELVECVAGCGGWVFRYPLFGKVGD